MNHFNTAFSSAQDVLMEFFGQSATYTDYLGVSHDIEVAIDQDREVMGGDYQTSYMAVTFTFKSGLVEVNRGDSITHSGKVYTVEAPLSEDRYFSEVIVKLNG